VTEGTSAVPRRAAGRDGSEVASLLARAAEAQTVAGDSQVGRQLFERAYELAERDGDVQAMAAAVLGQGGLRVHEQRTAEGDVMVFRLRQLAGWFAPESSIGLQIRARLAAESDYRAGEHAAILDALAAATRAADPVARASALSLAHHCLLGPDLEHAKMRRRLAVDLVGESVRTGRRSDLLMGMLWKTVDLLIEGDRLVERSHAELRQLLAEQNHRAVGYLSDVIDVTFTIRAGRFEQAEAQAQACFAAGMAIGDLDAYAFHTSHLIAIRWYQGRGAEIVPLLSEMVHSPTLRGVDSSLFAALATAAALAGDRLTAAGVLATLCGRDLAELPRSSSWLSAMFGIAETAHMLGDAVTSARVYELLTPHADQPVVASFGALCLGSVQHALGVAALTTGDLDRAIAHFDAAIRGNLALRHWPAVVSSRARYAQALFRTGDRVLAGAALAEAGREAATLGIPVPEYPAGEPAEQTSATCERAGQHWLVRYGGRSARVAHSAGMPYLAVLLANPGRDVPAVDLAAGANALSNAAPSGQPVLDQVAIRRYRERIEELRIRIEKSGPEDRPEQTADAMAERKWLLAELASAAGMAGRTRKFSDNHERARLAVGKAIRRTILGVEKADAAIGAHLRDSVRTGVRCSYRPS
jgi:tetratricopeptide (TPR) repeat protein